MAIVGSYVDVPHVESELWWRLEHVGAFGTGLAIAFLVAADPWRRIIVGFVFAAAAVYAIDIQTAGMITTFLVTAITVWWLLRLAAVVPAHARTLPQRLRANDA